MTCDLHNHSCYSFDGSASVEALCRAAIRHKIDILAITDHCDMTPERRGSAPISMENPPGLRNLRRFKGNWGFRAAVWRRDRKRH